MVAREREAGERARRRRREQRAQVAFAAQVAGGVCKEQAAGCEARCARLPVAADLKQQRVAQETGGAVVGDVQRHEFVVVQQEGLAVEEVGPAAEQRSLEARRRVHADGAPNVVGLGLEHRHRVGQRRAAPPALDDARVARSGERTGAEVGGDVQRVGGYPFDIRLGLRQCEAIGDEGLGNAVELALDRRVGTAARERDHRVAVRRAQARRAAPDPVLAFGGGQRVEVEHDLPGRLRLAVFGQRGAPPQATRLGGVLPQVVEPRPAPRDGRDAVSRVQHFEQFGPQRRVFGLRLQQRLRLGVALAHPGQRTVAVDLFEPEKFVCLGSFNGCRVHASKSCVWGWRRMWART